jgi:hypothetical protein
MLCVSASDESFQVIKVKHKNSTEIQVYFVWMICIALFGAGRWYYKVRQAGSVNQQHVLFGVVGFVS